MAEHRNQIEAPLWLQRRLAELPPSGWIRRAGIAALADDVDPTTPGALDALAGRQVTQEEQARVVEAWNFGILHMQEILRNVGLIEAVGATAEDIADGEVRRG